MSALHLRPIKRGSIEADHCGEVRCGRKGRFAVDIAGYPLISERPLTKGRRIVLCAPHAAEMEGIWLGALVGASESLELAA